MSSESLESSDSSDSSEGEEDVDSSFSLFNGGSSCTLLDLLAECSELLSIDCSDWLASLIGVLLVSCGATGVGKEESESSSGLETLLLTFDSVVEATETEPVFEFFDPAVVPVNEPRAVWSKC